MGESACTIVTASKQHSLQQVVVILMDLQGGYVSFRPGCAWLLPGKSHGWRSLVGCSPWGHKESDMTERLHFHFSQLGIGEGNGSVLAWRVPGMGLHRVGHDRSDLAAAAVLRSGWTVKFRLVSCFSF